jgi:hypothetical protein
MSNSVELGKPPAILVTVSTGRNSIDHLRLLLVCPNIVWKYAEVLSLGILSCAPAKSTLAEYVCCQGEGVELEAGSDSLMLRGLKEEGKYSFSLPHSDASAPHDLVGCSLWVNDP